MVMPPQAGPELTMIDPDGLKIKTSTDGRSVRRVVLSQPVQERVIVEAVPVVVAPQAVVSRGYITPMVSNSGYGYGTGPATTQDQMAWQQMQNSQSMQWSQFSLQANQQRFSQQMQQEQFRLQEKRQNQQFALQAADHWQQQQRQNQQNRQNQARSLQASRPTTPPQSRAASGAYQAPKVAPPPVGTKQLTVPRTPVSNPRSARSR
jgi:hypothetical protein